MLEFAAFVSEKESFQSITMPLFELYRKAKEKLDSSQERNRTAKEKLDSSQERNPSCSTNLSPAPENDFVELVWENGQILMQGQSSRARKNPPSNSLPSHTPKTGDKDIGNETNRKIEKFGTIDSVLNEIPMAAPASVMVLSQDDDMVPWLNYPMVESLQTEYCSDFLPELSGVTLNEVTTQNNFASFSRSSGDQSVIDSHTASVQNGLSSEQGNSLKVSTVGGGEATRPISISNQSSPSQSQQFQTLFPYLRSRISENIGDSMSYSATRDAVCGDSSRVLSSIGSFPSIKMQKQDPVPPNNKSGVVNFSHFLRPATFVKANLQNIGVMANSSSSSIERMGSKDKGPAASSNPAEPSLTESISGLRKETSSHCHPTMVASKVDVRQLEAKPLNEPLAAEPPKAVCPEDASKNDKNPCQSLAESATEGLPDGEKTIEPAVASSSVCSGNSVERVSDDPTHNLKRKHRDTEDSECPSEDIEEESMGTKKAVAARLGMGSKRSRAAEVHNLSERRRRDRINEKMRALQELIPNCNKVDKASMLDEAIEYLKTLQLQVQIMSMGAGLYMPPVLPTVMQHMHAAHMAHFSPMGVGMGMGMGMGMGFGMGMPDMNGGSSGCPMVQVPHMHGAHFPGPPMSGPAALHGMAGFNLQLFGLPGHGLPMSMPRASLIPMSGGYPALELNGCGIAGSMENLDSATASSSRNPMQNISSQVMQNSGADSSMNQKSAQCQAMIENFKQPDLVQDNCQASEATGRAFKSANGNDDRPCS